MFGINRTVARIATTALILAFTLMALPINRTPVLAYAGNGAFTAQFLSDTFLEGQWWPDAADPSDQGQVAVFTEVGSTFGTDGSTCQSVNSYTATINWGDGNSSLGQVSLLGNDGTGQCQYAVSGAHSYTSAQTIFPSVSISDPNGSLTINGGTLQVHDAPLSDVNGGVGLNLPFTEGHQGSNVLLATFQDADTGCSITKYALTVDWGDGQTGNATIKNIGNCQFQVLGTHTYAEEGSYQVKVGVADTAVSGSILGSVVSFVDTANVSDAAITGSSSVSLSPVEGSSTGQVLIATFTDDDPACTASDYHTTVDWGDATGADTTAHIAPTTLRLPDAPKCSFDVFDTHTYAEEGTYTGTITVFDNGTQAPFNFSAVVADAALTSIATGDLSNTFVEGAPSTVFVGTFHDNDPGCALSDYTVTINWGDGVIETTPSANITVSVSSLGTCDFDINATHTYAEESFAGYQFSATVVDHNATTSFNALVPVADAALSNIANPAVTGIEGNLLHMVPVGQFHDADPGCLASDYTATIDWGDGTTPDVVTSTTYNGSGALTGYIALIAGCTFQVYGEHTYRDEGLYHITVTVQDTTYSTVILGGPSNVTTMDDAVFNTVGAIPDPAVFPSAPVNPIEGTPFTGLFLGSFHDNVDPGATPPYCDAADYVVTIDWGDGANPDNTSPTHDGMTTATAANGGIVVSTHNPGSCNFDVLGAYNYNEEGNYTVHVHLADLAPGCVGTPPGTCTPKVLDWITHTVVDDAAVTTVPTPVLPNNDLFPTEGQPTNTSGAPNNAQYLGTVHDADQFCSASDFVVTIDWGDLTPLDTTSGFVVPSTHTATSCDFDVYGLHTYTEESKPGTPYQVTVTVTDHNNSAIIHDQATVADAPLTDLRDNQISPFEGIAFNPSLNITNVAPNNNLFLGTFQDTDMTQPCLANGYQVQSIDWGDGTPLDTNQAHFAIGPVTTPNTTCKFWVFGTHTYAEESEPGVPYQLTVVVKDIGEPTWPYGTSLLTLSPTAVVQDAPLTIQPGQHYTTIDNTYPYTATTGPNNPTAACWLLTECTRLIATFTDTATTCTSENESLTGNPAHYTVSINWGDGTAADTDPANWSVVPHPGGPPCQFDVYGTHYYTTISPHPNVLSSALPAAAPFTIQATITDEGGAVIGAGTTQASGATIMSVNVPSTSPVVHSPASHLVTQYSYPPGSRAPTYFLSLNVYHYNNLLNYVAHLQFQDSFHYQNPNGLYIPQQPNPTRPTSNCATTYSFATQCNLTPLGIKCQQQSSTSAQAILFAAYRYKTRTTVNTAAGKLLVGYVRIDLTQSGVTGKNDDFVVSMSSPETGSFSYNYPYFAQSHPATIPVNTVHITC